jgi:hypothetical protein
MTETELLRVRVLDWLLDYQPDEPGTMAEINNLAGEEGDLSPTEQALWRDVLSGLRDDGLIKLAASLGFNWGLVLTDRGRREAEARRARRQNSALRRAHARDVLLWWLYEQPGHEAEDFEGFLTSNGVYYEGLPLGTSDIAEAVDYLLDREMIAGVASDIGLISPKVTNAGMDCIDQYGGSVSEYLRRNDGARTTVNIGSVAGSNLAVANRDVAQNLHTGLGGQDIASLLQAIVEATPTLGLSPDDETDLKDAVRQSGTELAKPSPDRGWAKSLLKRTGEILAQKTAGALGPVLAAYLKHLAIKHGIPIED